MRTNLSLSPKGAARAIRLPRVMASPGHDGIAEQRHDERAAAQRPLAAKARDQFGGGGSGGGRGEGGGAGGHLPQW